MRSEGTGQIAAPQIGETGKYRDTQITRAENQEWKLPWKPVVG